MGYRLDFTIDKRYIDTGPDGDYFDEEIHVFGSSVVDSVVLEQDGQTIGMHVEQFIEMMVEMRKSSLWRGIELAFKREGF